jgi:RNA polymerase sigma-70 factor (ECF subfamily)
VVVSAKEAVAVSEAEVVAGLRRGDVAVFEQVYLTHQPRLYGFVFRLLGQRDLADDVTQEVWIRLATHAPRLRPDTRIVPWLFTVARNLTLSHRRWARLDFLHRGRLSLDPPAAGASPLELASAAETERRLEAALAGLPDKYREVLLLVAVEGLPHEVAAQVIGLRPDAFRQRLLRARGMIEASLGR